MKLLIADDEPLARARLRSLAAGIADVDIAGEAANGKQALYLSCELAPDIILLDIRMPVMDGLEAALSIWNSYGIPSAVITAYSDPTYIERAQQTGVYGYLLKPATADALRVSLSVAWARACAAGDANKRIGQLERLLASRRIIEQAKWKLVEARKMSEPEAHNFLQTEARNHRRRLIDVASEIVGVPVPAGIGDGAK